MPRAVDDFVFNFFSEQKFDNPRLGHGRVDYVIQPLFLVLEAARQRSVGVNLFQFAEKADIVLCGERRSRVAECDRSRVTRPSRL